MPALSRAPGEYQKEPSALAKVGSPRVALKRLPGLKGASEGPGGAMSAPDADADQRAGAVRDYQRIVVEHKEIETRVKKSAFYCQGFCARVQ